MTIVAEIFGNSLTHLARMFCQRAKEQPRRLELVQGVLALNAMCERAHDVCERAHLWTGLGKLRKLPQANSPYLSRPREPEDAVSSGPWLACRPWGGLSLRG